jgi:hypothetical protein
MSRGTGSPRERVFGKLVGRQEMQCRDHYLARGPILVSVARSSVLAFLDTSLTASEHDRRTGSKQVRCVRRSSRDIGGQLVVNQRLARGRSCASTRQCGSFGRVSDLQSFCLPGAKSTKNLKSVIAVTIEDDHSVLTWHRELVGSVGCVSAPAALRRMGHSLVVCGPRSTKVRAQLSEAVAMVPVHTRQITTAKERKTIS